MPILFVLAAAVALAATALAVTRTMPVHGLLYLIVSLLAVAIVFFLLGAQLMAALEVIVYAGAIMVLFLFVIMLLHLGPTPRANRRRLPPWQLWLGPAALSAVLLAEWAFIMFAAPVARLTPTAVPPADVGAALFGPYLIGVELASLLLLAGLVGGLYLGQPCDDRGDER